MIFQRVSCLLRFFARSDQIKSGFLSISKGLPPVPLLRSLEQPNLLQIPTALKGTVSQLCARASIICFSKDNRTVMLIWQDFLPDRPADGGLLFTLSSNILDFWRRLSYYLKFGSRHKDSSWFYRQQGRFATRKSRFARFKNGFSKVKLVSEVNYSKSSNICLICSRSSLKRLKDINKNTISTLWISAKVSQKLYYDFMALVFLNM